MLLVDREDKQVNLSKWRMENLQEEYGRLVQKPGPLPLAYGLENFYEEAVYQQVTKLYMTCKNSIQLLSMYMCFDMD